MRIVHGDPDARGDVSVEGTYEIGSQDQAFLGPESGLAVPDGEGGVDIYVATQWLHVDRARVAPCLGLPLESVRIHLAGVGGAFGGREDLSMQIHGAMLALHTNRPVKIVYNREESFSGHVHRHPAKIWCEHRATRSGRLVSVRMRILLDGGAYASSSTAVASNAASFAVGPYETPNALIESTVVGFKNIAYSEGFDDYCAARVRLLPDGSAEVHCAAAEVGQGVSGVILQVARTELGIDDVRLAPGQTATVDSSGSASASRMTWMAAGAVRDACRAALEEQARRPGEEVDVEQIYRHPRTTPLDPETGQITG